MNKKAIALFSGGLDSVLATKIISDQGIEIHAVNFVIEFASKDIENHKKRVTETIHQIGLVPEFIDISKEYMSFASLLINMGNFTEAENYLQKAYEIIKNHESEFGRNISYYYRLMGKLYDNKVVKSLYFNHSEKLQRKTNLETAILWYQKALSSLNFPAHLTTTKIDSIFTLSNLECLNILGFIANNFQNIAVLFQYENQDIFHKNINQSIDYYTFIGDFINRLRKEITGDENKIQLSEIQESTVSKRENMLLP